MKKLIFILIVVLALISCQRKETVPFNTIEEVPVQVPIFAVTEYSNNSDTIVSILYIRATDHFEADRIYCSFDGSNLRNNAYSIKEVIIYND